MKLSPTKITYDTVTRGGVVTITAHLPAGFTMREYSRVFQLKDAGEDLRSFLLKQQDEMFADLVRRLAPELRAQVELQQLQSGR
jgi:hypothetical protein